MSVSLSIKNVPDDVLERLRERAKRNRRSMQGELITILEEAVGPGKITMAEAIRRVKALGLKTEGDSTAMIREDRDAR
jgi:plasmid stability protein